MRTLASKEWLLVTHVVCCVCSAVRGSGGSDTDKNGTRAPLGPGAWGALHTRTPAGLTAAGPTSPASASGLGCKLPRPAFLRMRRPVSRGGSRCSYRTQRRRRISSRRPPPPRAPPRCAGRQCRRRSPSPRGSSSSVCGPSAGAACVRAVRARWRCAGAVGGGRGVCAGVCAGAVAGEACVRACVRAHVRWDMGRGRGG